MSLSRKTIIHSALAACLAIGASFTGTSLFAQVIGPRGAYGPYYPPYGPTYYSHHSSTFEEGVARGMADIIRSAGAANLLHSEAAKNYEDARAKYLDNRLKATATYFELKQLNQDYRQEMRGQRATSEQLFRVAKERAPDLLTATELDPYSGEIRWPRLLLASTYTDNRVVVEDLVRQRVSDPAALTIEQRASLRAALGSLSVQMRANISAYDPKEYASAKNFLNSLAATTGVGAL